MKTLLLTTLLAYFYADYRRYKAECAIRHAAGESDYERRKRLPKYNAKDHASYYP